MGERRKMAKRWWVESLTTKPSTRKINPGHRTACTAGAVGVFGDRSIARKDLGMLLLLHRRNAFWYLTRFEVKFNYRKIVHILLWKATVYFYAE
jgi:hypothetical protein